jgi:hypothetical protein
VTAPTWTLAQAARLIAAREPIFHHPECGTCGLTTCRFYDPPMDVDASHRSRLR